MTPRTQSFLVALFLSLIIVAIYSPALHYDFTGLDDNELVVRNADIKVSGFDQLTYLLKRHYITLYVPVTMLTYALDYKIWGLVPFGFRFTNLVIHLLNAFLVFYFVRLLQKNFWIALGVTLMFAVHPVQIESVVWVAERKNVLSSLFLFSSLICYWKAAVNRTHETQFLLAAFACFALGLLSKPNVVIFVPLIFLLNHFYLDGHHEIKRRAWFYAGTIIFCTAFTALTIFGTATDVEVYAFHGNSYWINLFVMMTVFWKYWLLLFLPYHQNVLYLSPIYNSLSNPPVLISFLGLLVLFSCLWILAKRNKPAAFWLCWFLVGLAPVSNLIAPLPSIMNDRYLYVPIIGFFACLFILMERFSSGLIFGAGKQRAGGLTAGVIGLMLIPMVVLTTQRIPDWETGGHLWESALKRAPREDSRIFYYYGIDQLDQGHYERSVELLKKSLSLHKSIDVLLALGTACVAAEKYDEAETNLKKVIELDPKRSGAYDQLAVVYRKAKRYEEAKPLFEKAIELQPRSAVLYNNYALYFMDIEEPEMALEKWEYALQLDPDCHFALRNLAWFYFLRKQWGPAAHYLIRYLRRDPHDKQMLDLIPVIEPHLTEQEAPSSPA